MSTIQASNLNDGTISVPTTYLTNGSAKAWVNFNGTGTIASRDSFNVASLTDTGTGQYTVTFSSAMATANYSWAGLCGSPAVLNGYQIVGTPLAASVPLVCTNTSTAVADFVYVVSSVQGDLA